MCSIDLCSHHGIKDVLRTLISHTESTPTFISPLSCARLLAIRIRVSMDAVSVLQTVLSAIQSGSLPLNGSEVLAANATAPPPTAVAITPLSLLQLPTLIAHVLSLSAVRDWLKLLLIGGALEMCRRFLTSSWSAIKNYFWITVTLEEGDDCGCECSFGLTDVAQPHAMRIPQIGFCTGSQGIRSFVSITSDDAYACAANICRKSRYRPDP